MTSSNVLVFATFVNVLVSTWFPNYEARSVGDMWLPDDFVMCFNGYPMFLVVFVFSCVFDCSLYFVGF
jgi:hypothetical protein